MECPSRCVSSVCLWCDCLDLVVVIATPRKEKRKINKMGMFVQYNELTIWRCLTLIWTSCLLESFGPNSFLDTIFQESRGRSTIYHRLLNHRNEEIPAFSLQFVVGGESSPAKPLCSKFSLLANTSRSVRISLEASTLLLRRNPPELSVFQPCFRQAKICSS